MTETIVIPAASISSLIDNIRDGLSKLPNGVDSAIAQGSCEELAARLEKHPKLFEAFDRFADDDHYLDLQVHYLTPEEYAAWDGTEKRAEKVKGESVTRWKDTGKSPFQKGDVRVVVFAPREDETSAERTTFYDGPREREEA